MEQQGQKAKSEPVGEKSSVGATEAVVGIVTGLIAEHGGLNFFVEKFEKAGLGPMVRSWVGKGANMPVEPGQVHQTLGENTIGKLSEKLGIPAGELSEQLAKLIPQVVDQMTPEGKVPEGPSKIGQMFKSAVDAVKKAV